MQLLAYQDTAKVDQDFNVGKCDGWMDLTNQEIYDSNMMWVLQRARCTLERTNVEYLLGGE